MVRKAHLNTLLGMIIMITLYHYVLGFLKWLGMLNTLKIIIRQCLLKSLIKKLLKKYTKIWKKISSLINKEFDSEPVYGDSDKYIKTKIKSYGDKINTNFQGRKIPKENTSYKCS